MHSEWQRLLVDLQPKLEQIEGNLARTNYQPSPELVMRAFIQPPSAIKVVIIGQDPYPNPEHAVGLAFAVPPKTEPLPPTLRNILFELATDLGVDPAHTRQVDLANWAAQGVMLLNRHLTTSPGASLAHENFGWVHFTDRVAQVLCEREQPAPIFVLWGNQAQQLSSLLPSGVMVISAPHPSPLAAYRGFFGSRPFSQINIELTRRGQTAINWLHA